jgi:3-oxoacyl-[acyl-carrier protein] reductase
VAVNTKSSREDADTLVKAIREGGGAAEACIADIADPAAVNAMAEAVLKRFGRIDILVLNASQRREVPFKDMSFEEWRTTMSITLDGSFHCIKACLPSMVANGGGNIVTLGGDGVLLGNPGKAHNTAAKNGLVGLTRVLAKELAADGIRVNCVSPGSINTTRPAHRSPRACAKGAIPLGRWGEPEEIAAVVRFLCGPGGGFITGQTVHVNGGNMMFA